MIMQFFGLILSAMQIFASYCVLAGLANESFGWDLPTIFIIKLK